MSEGEQVYRGKSLVVRFDSKKCIASRNCVLGRPDVFVVNAPAEWILPDAAPAEEIAAVVRACPSGALTYERLDGVAGEAPSTVNVAHLRENGPIALRGELVINITRARPEGRDAAIEGHGPAMRATLCRCGHSKNKPFCDTTHLAAVFVATGEVPTEDSKALAERGGKLEIAPSPDGPLRVTGNLEICTGTGRIVNRVQKAALCRCGGSDNKPYCDGAHKKNGFTSD